MLPDALEQAVATILKHKWVYLSALIIIGPTSFAAGAWYYETVRAWQTYHKITESAGSAQSYYASDVQIEQRNASGSKSKEYISAKFIRVDFGRGEICKDKQHPFIVSEHYIVEIKNLPSSNIIMIRRSEKVGALHAFRVDVRDRGEVKVTYCAVPEYNEDEIIAFSDANGHNSNPIRINVSAPKY